MKDLWNIKHFSYFFVQWKNSISGRLILYVFFLFVFYQSGFSKIVYDYYFICLKYFSNVYFVQSAFLILFLKVLLLKKEWVYKSADFLFSSTLFFGLTRILLLPRAMAVFWQFRLYIIHILLNTYEEMLNIYICFYNVW